MLLGRGCIRTDVKAQAIAMDSGHRGKMKLRLGFLLLCRHLLLRIQNQMIITRFPVCCIRYGALRSMLHRVSA